ncbi:MAG: hypothetical protein QME25_04725 [Bacteroidota bacterium]|nr:hypothetical protein [Bacteroidota bacterium]
MISRIEHRITNNFLLINNVCPGYMLTKRQEEIIKKRSSDQNLSVEEYMT